MILRIHDILTRLMQADKWIHLALGVIVCIAACAGSYIYATWGLGPLLAFTSTTIGIAYEVQQKIRGEGQVEALDALATALPGWVAWAIIDLIFA
jgi:hypothetical protein